MVKGVALYIFCFPVFCFSYKLLGHGKLQQLF